MLIPGRSSIHQKVGSAPYVVAKGAASTSVTMGAAMVTGAAMVVIAGAATTSVIIGAAKVLPYTPAPPKLVVIAGAATVTGAAMVVTAPPKPPPKLVVTPAPPKPPIEPPPKPTAAMGACERVAGALSAGSGGPTSVTCTTSAGAVWRTGADGRFTLLVAPATV